MAKLDDSIVSHVSITSESPYAEQKKEGGTSTARMQELLSGVETREKLLDAK